MDFSPITTKATDSELSTQAEKALMQAGIVPPPRREDEVFNPFDPESRFHQDSWKSALINRDPKLAEILIGKVEPLPYSIRNLSTNPWIPGQVDDNLQSEIQRYRPELASRLQEEAREIALQRFQESIKKDEAERLERQRKAEEYRKSRVGIPRDLYGRPRGTIIRKTGV